MIPNNAQIYLSYTHPDDKGNNWNPRKISVNMYRANSGQYSLNITLLERASHGPYKFKCYLPIDDELFTRKFRFLRPYLGFIKKHEAFFFQNECRCVMDEEEEDFLVLWEFMHDHPGMECFQTGDMYKENPRPFQGFRE